MPNMNPKKLPAREQAPDVRNKNFDEVSQGYDEAMAMEEAARCLNCKHRPCVSGCRSTCASRSSNTRSSVQIPRGVRRDHVHQRPAAI